MATRTQFASRPHVDYDLQRHDSAQSEGHTQYEREMRANLANQSEVSSQKSSRRDRVQILLKMLQAAESPIRKTHLMYGAGINFYQLEKHLTFLIGSGMIEELQHEGNIAYRTTEKGRMFSQLFT